MSVGKNYRKEGQENPSVKSFTSRVITISYALTFSRSHHTTTNRSIHVRSFVFCKKFCHLFGHRGIDRRTVDTYRTYNDDDTFSNLGERKVTGTFST